MPGFADSFWSGDYAGGLGVLFTKLQQGVIENEQILAIAKMRADAEDQYGRKLDDVYPVTDKMAGGFQRDDGASLRKAYEGIRTEMSEAAKNHKKIASNINELVINPFGRWCDAHESRVQNSHDDLQTRIRAHDKQAEVVRKLRSTYFNKCRLVEDLEEENKLAFPEPEKVEVSSPKMPKTPKTPTPTIKLPESEAAVVDEEELARIEIGDESYMPEQVKKILTDMLNSIKLGEVKVPILGTYHNVSTGSDITEYVQRNLNAPTVGYAEKIGQDLVDNGFLRLVGNVGSSFANSSKMKYQWRPKVFQITGFPEKSSLGRADTTGSLASLGSGAGGAGGDTPIMGSMGEMLSTWNPLNNPHPNETPMEKLQREARESDEKYKAGVRKLDSLRCNLEEAMVDHLKFMERCELDRLKAVRAVMLDFSGAISNVIPSLQSTVDNMMLYQETVTPLGDLRYLIESYRTGGFSPKVQIYDNYYNKVDELTFGVDLEARARHDRKRVPIIITTILTFLDNHYPDLEGDEARRAIWLVDVPLAASHHLRNSINNGKAVPREILERYEIPIVASVLKLYLLELPDSLVSCQVYEIIKAIYSSPESSESEATRVPVLQNTLGQLRLANIATLDAITTHFTRLIELTSADEAFVASLAQSLAPCVLRPRTESALTLHDRHAYRLVRDLLDHKEEIFGELKRASSQSHSQGTIGGAGGGGGSSSVGLSAPPGGRARAPSSTDESNRRANMEARQRAIMSRSRAGSPGPSGDRSSHGNGSGGAGGASANGRPTAAAAAHRRDRSIGAAETRFPVVTSPNPATGGGSGEHQQQQQQHHRSRVPRHSLDVPDSAPSTPRATSENTLQSQSQSQSQAQAAPSSGSPPVEMSHSALPDRTATTAADAPNGTSTDHHHHHQHRHHQLEEPPATAASASAGSSGGGGGDGAGIGVEKKNSLTRSGHVAAAAGRINRKAPGAGSGKSLTGRSGSAGAGGSRESIGSQPESLSHGGGGGGGGADATPERAHGVELKDRPMDF